MGEMQCLPALKFGSTIFIALFLFFCLAKFFPSQNMLFPCLKYVLIVKLWLLD